MATGQLTSTGQDDWLQVYLVGDQPYEFTVTGLGSLGEVVVGALTPSTETVGESVFAGSTTSTRYDFFTPATSGTYYVQVADFSATPETYSVTAQAVTTDYTDNATTKGVVAVGGAATTGTLSQPGQDDWLAVSLVANQAYEFTVTGLGTLGEVIVGALTPSTETVGESTFAGSSASTKYDFFRPTTSGTYYVQVSDFSATPESYSLTAQAVTTDYTDNATTTGVVTVGGAATTGTLSQPGQDDWVAVSLVANQGYEFTVTGLGALGAVVVGGLTPSTETVGESIFVGTSAADYDFFRPTASGTYYVQVSDFSASPEGYSVSAKAVSTDYTDDTTTTGVVTIGGAATTGTLGQPGQADWLAVSLVANQGYEFTVTGLGTLGEVVAGALTPSTETVGEGTFAGGTTSTRYDFFRPTTSGTYYVQVSDFSASPEGYTVSAQAVTTDYTDNTTTTGIVTVGGAATTGTLSQPGQDDWLAVSLVANQGYDFTVTGLGALGAVVVGGLTPSTENVGASIFTGSTTATKYDFFTPTSSGTYYVQVSDFSASPESYTVSAQAVTTDYTDNTTTAGVVAVACFASGTRLATPAGERAIEHLRPGDLVLTAAGSVAPVIWTGHRRVDCDRHPRRHEADPVRVRAGALAPNVPARDVLLSPEHAIAIGNVLIPVRHLANDCTIRQERRKSITYWHVELPRHGVVLASGLPCESYLDTGSRGAFAGETAPRQLHPDFARHAWQAGGCAELVCDGPRLADARRQILARAQALGYGLTQAPALHVTADGTRLKLRLEQGVGSVILPPGTRIVSLLSRAGVPADLTPDAADIRRLGVAVGALSLDGVDIPLASACLTEGWHDLEGDSAGRPWRWTDGAACIRLDGMGGRLRVKIAAATQYRATSRSRRAAG